MSALQRLREEYIKSAMIKEAIPGQGLIGKGLAWAGKRLLNSGQSAASRTGGLLGEGATRSTVGNKLLGWAKHVNPPRGIANFKRVGSAGTMGPALPEGFQTGAVHGPWFPESLPVGPAYGPAMPKGFQTGAVHGPWFPESLPVGPGSGPTGPTGGLGGMLDYIKARPWWMAAGAGAGGAMLGNSYGQGTGYNDAMSQYQQNTSGFGGTLAELGHALGLVPTQNMFMPKSGSVASFLKAASTSSSEAEEMYKQAFMQGVRMLGKSVLGGMMKPWSKTLSGFGSSALRNGEQAAASAVARNAPNAATAGSRWTGLGNKLQDWGKRVGGRAERWSTQGDVHLNAINGWGGSMARGARAVGNLAGWSAHPSVLASMGLIAPVDGLLRRKAWTEDGARMGVAQSMAAAQNMNPMQRLAFLFAPGTVANRGLSQVEQMLPGVTDEYNKIMGGL